MNEGLYGQSYGAPLKVSRVRYLVGQTGSLRYLGEAVVLGTTDNLSGQTTRHKGGAASQADRTDLVLQVPVTLGRVGQPPAAAGALLVQLPDGTSFGGVQRGIGAVDLQAGRSGSDRVAWGDYSVVVGGYNNMAGRTVYAASQCAYSFVGGGNNNNAETAYSAIVGGSGNRVFTSNYSFIGGGSGNNASGAYSNIAGGGSNSVSDSYATIGGGDGNTADGYGSTISGGMQATTRAGYGAQAYASGRFAVTGDAQTKTHALRNSLSGALSNQPLLADGATNTANYHINLPNDATYLFEAHVVARRTDTNDESAGWIIRGVVDRNASAATIALVGTPSVTEVARDAALNASVSCDVDTTLGVLRILTTVTDSGKTVRFVAKVYTVEVVG